MIGVKQINAWASGWQGLKLAESIAQVDLIWLDIQLPYAREGDAETVAERLVAERGTNHMAYRVMQRDSVTLNGRPALMERFAYVDSRSLIGATPQVIEGIDYIFVHDRRAVVVTMLVAPEQIEEIGPLFRRFLGSLSF